MTIVHVYSLTLEVIGIFQIFTLCLIVADMILQSDEKSWNDGCANKAGGLVAA